MTSIPANLRRFVIARAHECCEYCLQPNETSFFPHEIDHILAEKHGGLTEADNLAFACWRCNRHKGTDFGSIDPATEQVVMFFNPRTQNWLDHFRFEGAIIEPITPEGLTTVRILQINRSDRLAELEVLLAKDIYPPPHIKDS